MSSPQPLQLPLLLLLGLRGDGVRGADGVGTGDTRRLLDWGAKEDTTYSSGDNAGVPYLSDGSSRGAGEGLPGLLLTEEIVGLGLSGPPLGSSCDTGASSKAGPLSTSN